MSLELLDKTRKINRLLTEQETDKVNFNDFCKVLSGALEVNVLLVSRKGKVLGMKEKRNIDVIPQLKDTKYGCYIDSAVQERFMNIRNVSVSFYLRVRKRGCLPGRIT